MVEGTTQVPEGRGQESRRDVSGMGEENHILDRPSMVIGPLPGNGALDASGGPRRGGRSRQVGSLALNALFILQ